MIDDRVVVDKNFAESLEKGETVAKGSYNA
jgi:hypothetical protein